MLVAILTAKTGDDMAKAIGSFADPPGGWRTKQRQETHMLSITAEAGWYGGAEWRFGNYGVVKEHGRPIYAQPPTLALPVGLEYTYGAPHGSVGVFFPILDPAAFLTYDASHGARLPGPSVFTALSPGVAFKWGVQSTPFSVLPFFIVRPGFRQWKPDADGFGATALQAGLLLGVDVTLFSLASWSKSVETTTDESKPAVNGGQK